MTFLDLGAWIGPMSLYASRVARRIVAVEPDPVAFDILQRNIALNGGGVELINEAISNFNGSLTLGSTLLGASTTRASREAGPCGPWAPGQEFTVKCSALRTFVEAHALEDPLFIKMDVEGSEEQILSDLSFFREHKPALFVSLHPFWFKSAYAVSRTLGELRGIYRHTQVNGDDWFFHE